MARKITRAQLVSYLEANDIVEGSIVQVETYVLAKRFSVEEWVYVEVT